MFNTTEFKQSVSKSRLGLALVLSSVWISTSMSSALDGGPISHRAKVDSEIFEGGSAQSHSDSEFVTLSCDQIRESAISGEIKGKLSGLGAVAGGGLGAVRFLTIPTSFEARLRADKQLLTNLKSYLEARRHREHLKVNLSHQQVQFRDVAGEAGLSSSQTDDLIEALKEANKGKGPNRAQVIADLRVPGDKGAKLVSAFDRVTTARLDVAIADGRVARLTESVRGQLEAKANGTRTGPAAGVRSEGSFTIEDVKRQQGILERRIERLSRPLASPRLARIGRTTLGLGAVAVLAAGFYLFVDSDLSIQRGVSQHELAEQLLEEQILCLARNQEIEAQPSSQVNY